MVTQKLRLPLVNLYMVTVIHLLNSHSLLLLLRVVYMVVLKVVSLMQLTNSQLQLLLLDLLTVVLYQ